MEAVTFGKMHSRSHQSVTRVRSAIAARRKNLSVDARYLCDAIWFLSWITS